MDPRRIWTRDEFEPATNWGRYQMVPRRIGAATKWFRDEFVATNLVATNLTATN
jgi:hypothetical protein